jgi:hypothetical protein
MPRTIRPSNVIAAAAFAAEGATDVAETPRIGAATEVASTTAANALTYVTTATTTAFPTTSRHREGVPANVRRIEPVANSDVITNVARASSPN